MPAVDERAIRVEGLRELSRAFAVADKTLSRELRKRLREAADPVRVDAEGLASSRIRKIGLTWSRMRVGVTRTSVYVAPRERGLRGIAGPRMRPNLAGLLMERAMIPSLEANIAGVTEAVDDVLATVGRAWEQA